VQTASLARPEISAGPPLVAGHAVVIAPARHAGWHAAEISPAHRLPAGNAGVISRRLRALCPPPIPRCHPGAAGPLDTRV